MEKVNLKETKKPQSNKKNPEIKKNQTNNDEKKYNTKK